MHVVVIMLYNLQLTPVHQIYIQSSIQETKQYEKGTLILAHTGAAKGVSSFWFVSDRVPEKWNFSEINVKYFDLNMSRSGDSGYASGSKKFFLIWSCVFVILINKKNIGLVSFDSWEVHGLCVWVHAFSDKGRTSRVACVHVAGNKSLSGCKLKRAGQIGHCRAKWSVINAIHKKILLDLWFSHSHNEIVAGAREFVCCSEILFVCSIGGDWSACGDICG